MIKDFLKKRIRAMREATQEEGLPDVAEKANKRKPLVLVAIGVIVIILLMSHFLAKTKTKVAKPIEETYMLKKNDIKEENNVKNNFSSPNESQPLPHIPSRSDLTAPQLAYLQEKQKELEKRLSAPLMLVTNNNQTTEKETPTNEMMMATDQNMQFMRHVSSQESGAAQATTIGPLNSIIAEGNFIHAILESATNSDLPGYLRASVSSPSYSEDGSRILIPVGSRLIGQYKSGMMQGQSRIFVVWTRLITPEGISIKLGSSGVDNLGVAGMGADAIDRHFWQRFGTASLLSIIGAGAANVNVSGMEHANSASLYRTAISNSFSQSAGQSLQQNMMMAPTLETYQGKPIMVFVAHDLYFADALNQTKPKINVF